MSKTAIAITGSGIISAIGHTKAETLTSLLSNSSGIGSMRYLHSIHKDIPVGEVKLSNEEMKHLLGLRKEALISRTTLIACIALKEAIQEANLTDDDLKGKKIAFISGTTVGGMDLTEQYYNKLDINNSFANEILSKHDCGSCSDDIAQICGLNAEVITISTACSSALNAVILGCRMLLSNECDLVIAGGTEALSLFHFNGFNSLMILDKNKCRPFDKNRQGLNLGEGAAYVVLERNEDAIKRNVHALSYVGGWGNRCDAFHQTATSDNGEGAYLAMQDAMAMSGLSNTQIDYINAHGTGTPNNDMSESTAIKRLFGIDIPFVSSTKSFTGHTTSASGSIELVICLLAMQNDFIPANLGWKEEFENGIIPTLGVRNKKLNNVLCNSFGFGGNDSCIILSVNEVLLPAIEDKQAHILADVCIDSSEQLPELKSYVSPMESRRMGKLLKSAMLSSYKVLEIAGIDTPDAIISATSQGMLENSEKFLTQLISDGESTLSPTLFMQSTHNTISSAMAIRIKCHGYNITYTQGSRSLDLALRDARRLINEGKAKSVLVGLHDESTERFNSLLERCQKEPLPILFSRSILLCLD